MPFWAKKAPEGESDEQRKAREEGEQNAFISSLMTKFEEKIKPLSDKVGEWDNRWKTLEEAAKAGDPNIDGNQDDPDLSEDDKRKMREETEKRMLFAQGIANNARWVEQEALSTLGDEYRELIPKIKERFLQTPVERKGTQDYPQYCLNVINMCIGEAARAGGLRYDGANKRFFLEDASAGDRGERHDFLDADMTWTDPKSGKVLTGRDQLARLGITPEEFQKSIDKGVV